VDPEQRWSSLHVAILLVFQKSENVTDHLTHDFPTARALTGSFGGMWDTLPRLVATFFVDSVAF